MENIRKEQKRTLPMSDQLDLRNPQNLAEFAQDIFFSMIEKEKEFVIDNEYLRKV